MTQARILVPLQITEAMVIGGTSIPVVDTASGEVAWAIGTAYTVGQRVNYEGAIWEAVAASTGVKPGTDGRKWLRHGPSNRMAAFDEYTTTASTGTTSMTLVVRPGLFNGIRLDGLVGQSLTMTVQDGDGGPVVWTRTVELWEQAIGLYELLFSPLLQLRTVSSDGIPLCPDPVLTLTITTASGGKVGVGSVMLGDWRLLAGSGSFGGTQYGARMTRKSYTYWDERDDGTYSLLRRPSSRNVTCTVPIDADQAVYADALLEDIMDRLVAFEATDLPQYGYLNVAGFVTSETSADNCAVTSLSLSIKGTI